MKSDIESVFNFTLCMALNTATKYRNLVCIAESIYFYNA